MEWISVKDKLPEIDQQVLFCEVFDDDLFVCTGYYEEVYSGVVGFVDHFGREISSGVEFWMPLPEPPKE